MEKNVDLVFDNVFKEYYGKNKLLFDNYKKIYNLPTVTSECNVSKKYNLEFQRFENIIEKYMTAIIEQRRWHNE